MNCINCNTEFKTDFCPTCGEKKEIARITFFSLIENLFSSIANMDKGFLFNLKNLTLYPQKTVFNYIKGKRRQILNPISYSILTISVYLILVALLKEEKPAALSAELTEKIKNLNKFEKFGYNTGRELVKNLKFFWLLMPFSMSIFTRLIFKRFNFFEHLAINYFVVGHATIIAIIIKLIYHKEILLFNFIVFFFMIFLTYKIFLSKKEKAFSITMAIFSVFFAYLVFYLIPLLLVIYV